MKQKQETKIKDLAESKYGSVWADKEVTFVQHMNVTLSFDKEEFDDFKKLINKVKI